MGVENLNKSPQIWPTNGVSNGRLKCVAQAFVLLPVVVVFCRASNCFDMENCGSVFDGQIACGKINERQLVLVGRGNKTKQQMIGKNDYNLKQNWNDAQKKQHKLELKMKMWKST